MKKFIKNNIKVFVAIIITTILVGSVSVYAASQIFAKNITFAPTNENFKKENGEPIDNVEDALNVLYNKSSHNSTLVGAMTGPGQEYTFQNEGYIIGTMKASFRYAGAMLYFNEREVQENVVALAQYDTNNIYIVSVYVPKGTKVLTRDYGTYDLEIYEWK